MRVILVVCGIVLSGVAGLFIWGWISSNEELNRARPYIAYKRLRYLAEGCDRYKTQFNRWPNSLAELQAGRPECGKPWDKDAWGNEVVFVPYNDALGYGEIISYGRDRKPGGTGDDRDLEVRFPTDTNTNWNKHEGVGLEKPRINP